MSTFPVSGSLSASPKNPAKIGLAENPVDFPHERDFHRRLVDAVLDSPAEPVHRKDLLERARPKDAVVEEDYIPLFCNHRRGLMILEEKPLVRARIQKNCRNPVCPNYVLMPRKEI
jgi:hypothetical protein